MAINQNIYIGVIKLFSHSLIKVYYVYEYHYKTSFTMKYLHSSSCFMFVNTKLSLFSRISICLGFIGWIIYIFTVLIHQHTNIIQRHSQLEKLRQSFWTSEKGLRMVFGMFGISVMALLYG